MSFRGDLTDDLRTNFFNVDEFGEMVTLTRGNTSVTLQGLYDTPVVQNDLGAESTAIEHFPRLFVRQADLPGGKPAKGDVFTLSSTDFHTAIKLVALDYVFEKDGVVCYRCKYGVIQNNA
jgi:hypothetical protein